VRAGTFTFAGVVKVWIAVKPRSEPQDGQDSKESAASREQAGQINFNTLPKPNSREYRSL
jgi:hypothetical protein